MRIPRGSMVLSIAFVAVLLVAPQPAVACDCCACDLGGGDIECGPGDVDCEDCIFDADGEPAADCSVCDGFAACAGDTYCDDDTQGCFGAPTRTPTETPTATPTETPTATPTETPTETPTNALAPLGAACGAPGDCQSGFCASGVCCNVACDQPFQQCNLPGRAGLCSSTGAPAPAVSRPGLFLGVVPLTGVGVLALARRCIMSSNEKFR
jgi:hypothetical protein